MSFYLYDKAIADKIKSWVLDPHLTILYPDQTSRFFNQTADEQKDKISLPLIAISRDRDIDIQLPVSRYAEKTGKIFSADRYKAGSLRHIPMTINYQIDIYTRYRQEADEYVRNFVYNIIDYPTLKITIPYYDTGLESTSFMELDSRIQDNSDIPERLVPGQFTRMTLNVTLKDAQLYAYEIKEIPKVVSAEIKASLDIKEGQNNSHSINDNCESVTGEIILNTNN